MKNKIAIIVMGHLFNIAYACDTQVEYQSEFRKTENILEINIKRKDSDYFSFYDIPTHAYPISLGMRVQDKKIEYKLNNSLLYPKYQDNEQRYNEFFTLRHSQNLVSSYFLYKNDIHKYILKENKVNIFKTIIDINNYLLVHNEMIKGSNISGEQRINFYVIFLHDKNLEKCSYFESPVYSYNVDSIKYINNDSTNSIQTEYRIK